MKIEVLEDPIYPGAVAAEAGSFKKWLRQNHPSVEYVIPVGASKVDLHDITLVMPLVQLLADASVLNYLNLVLEYANHYFSGSLVGEDNKVHIRAKFYDERNGIKKTFEFEGSEESLKNAIKKFDLNKFMDN